MPLSLKSRAFQPKSQMPVLVSAIAGPPCNLCGGTIAWGSGRLQASYKRAGETSLHAAGAHQQRHAIDLEFVRQVAAEQTEPLALRLVGGPLARLRAFVLQSGDVLQVMDQLVHQHG